jgi:V/A-type H+-transporting ATPase subunit A
VRVGFLQQDALHPIDAYCTPKKQLALLALFAWLYDQGNVQLASGVSIAQLRETIDLPRLIRLKEEVSNDEPEQIDQMQQEIEKNLEELS